MEISEKQKVVVGCFTYNHANYIIDALNGFSMQQTAFPFACIIMDDASTDGTPEVIIDWLQRECQMEKAQYFDTELTKTIIVPHCSNANCTMAVYLLKRNLYNEGELKLSLVSDLLNRSEYVAICDGDDFWIDPQKLQKQADCLDNHPETDCCIHGYFKKDNKLFYPYSYSKEDSIIPLDEIILQQKYIPAAGSIFLRYKILCPVPRFVSLFPLDYSFLICGALRGGIYYLPQFMSTYRTGEENSISTIINTKSIIMKNFYHTEIKMLKALDEDLNYVFHKVIQARILLDNTNFTKCPVEDIRNILKYKEGLTILPLSIRIKLLLRCVIPQKIGHSILRFLKRVKKTKQIMHEV